MQWINNAPKSLILVLPQQKKFHSLASIYPRNCEQFARKILEREKERSRIGRINEQGETVPPRNPSQSSFSIIVSTPISLLSLSTSQGNMILNGGCIGEGSIYIIYSRIQRAKDWLEAGQLAATQSVISFFLNPPPPHLLSPHPPTPLPLPLSFLPFTPPPRTRAQAPL